ncbi:MAG TPA: hypothetical protein VJP39_02700 [Gaiellaceae bacterium]|nr:hypothetical protein [Gaiellaceae bacterium]
MRLRRSYDLHQNLTIMLVCAVATVVLTRAFLAATGYPQVGGSKFHIAHVLYGGLLLTFSLISVIGLLSPAARPLASVFGGVGFGLFIDEVGKFVTKDVNYFYKPAIAIIYVCFLVLFGIVRWLARRNFSSDERVLIGFDALQRAAVGSLSRERRGHVLALLESVDTPMANEVTALLERSAAEPERETVGRRIRVALRHAWHAATEHPRFRQLVLAVLAAAALVSAGEIAYFLRHGVHPLSGGTRAFVVVTVVADAMALVGALELRRSLLRALHWYDHAILLEITVGQVFLYASQQLAASLNLLALLVLWALVRSAIHFESAPLGSGPGLTPNPSNPPATVP